jgi:hypothetical protein
LLIDTHCLLVLSSYQQYSCALLVLNHKSPVCSGSPSIVVGGAGPLKTRMTFPLGMLKSKTAALVVPRLTMLAVLVYGTLATVPTAMVAASPLGPTGPVFASVTQAFASASQNRWTSSSVSNHCLPFCSF